VIHFHGDIHQPLHVGFIGDKGGNEIEGTYFGSSTSLHEIWDTGLINSRIQYDFDGSQTKYLDYLLGQLNTTWKEMANEWSICNSTATSDELETSFACPNEWAVESAKVACNYAYVDQNGDHIANGFALAGPYFDFTKTTLDQQLSKGGIRLAATMNKMWGSE